MQTSFLGKSDRQIYCRYAGAGPAVVLLHPSPLDGGIFAQHIDIAKSDFTSMALDLPGLGQSDPLPILEPSCADYAHHIVATLREAGIEQAHFWGVATGAYIALEIARLYPDFAAHTCVENFTASTADEKDAVFASYFPDLSPRWDGAHLATLWQFNRDVSLFFPWMDRSDETRTQVELAPASVIHLLAKKHIAALATWDIAYKAAFRFSDPDCLAPIPANVTVLRPESSILKHHVDRLTGLNENTRIVHLGWDRLENIKATLDIFRETVVSTAPVTLEAVAAMHVRVRGTAPTTLLLHDIPGNGGTALAEVDGAALAPDLLGYGLSASAPEGSDWTHECFANLSTLVDANPSVSNIIAVGASARFAHGLKNAHPDQIAEVTLVTPDLLEKPSFRTGLPNIDPEPYGEHLLRAWGYLRDTALYTRPLEPSADHRVDPFVDPDLTQLHRRFAAWIARGSDCAKDIQSLRRYTPP